MNTRDLIKTIGLIITMFIIALTFVISVILYPKQLIAVETLMLVIVALTFIAAIVIILTVSVLVFKLAKSTIGLIFGVILATCVIISPSIMEEYKERLSTEKLKN